MHPILASYFKLVKKFIPSNKDVTVIGLDVGVSSCRAVELARKDNSFEIVRATIEPIDGSDEKACLQKVLAALEISGKPRSIVASVFGKGTLIRYIEMPRMPLLDLKRAFVLETDRYFPFPKETIYTDCFILDGKNSDKKMSVLIAAVKKEIVDNRLKNLKEVGVEPVSVSLNAIAVANAYASLPPAAPAGMNGKAVAVVDIGESGTNLMVLLDGSPKFSRDILIGTNEIIKRVANVSGLAPQEARALLSSSDKSEDVQKSFEAGLSSLVSEIKMSFDYFVTEKNILVGQIYLVGDGVGLNGLEAFFGQSFDIPNVVWNPFEKIGRRPSVKGELFDTPANACLFVTALGLALNEYD